MLRAEDNKFPHPKRGRHADGRTAAPVLAARLAVRGTAGADGAPKKIVVMGEELLAFRDYRGRSA